MIMLLLATVYFFRFFEGYQSYCIDYEEMNDLDDDQLKGQWWEYMTFNVINPIESQGYDCMAVYFYPEDMNKITVAEDFIRRAPGIVNKERTIRSWTIIRTPESKNTYKGRFTGETLTASGSTAVFNYSVVDTDYHNWLIVNICGTDRKFGGTYVFARSQTLTRSQEEVIRGKIRDLNKRYERWMPITMTYTIKDNSDCKPVLFLDHV